MLSAAVLSFEDLIPGAIVEGEVVAVKPFGLLVKLGQGVQVLVPKMHLADATVKNPKIRFKVCFAWLFDLGVKHVCMLSAVDRNL